MGKAKKKTAISKKEEQQAQKVVKIVFVSLIILALIMLIAQGARKEGLPGR